MQVKAATYTYTHARLVAPTASASAGTVDQGQTSSLTSTAASGGTTPYTYQWLEEAPGATSYSSISGATSSNYSFVTTTSTTAGTYSFELKVTDSASTSTSVTSNAITVKVNSALVAPTASASAGTVDQGQTSVLSSSSVATGTSPYTFKWFAKAPGGSYVTVGTNSTSFSFVTSTSTVVGSWSFILELTDNTGAAVNSTAASVIVNVAPSVSVSPSSATLDLGQPQMFSATASGGTGSLSYQWYVNGAAQNDATASTFTYTASAEGSFTVYVKVTDNAPTSVTATSNSATVTVAASLTVSIAPVGPITLDVGQSQTFTATPTGGSGTIHYQWYLGGSAVSGATSSTYSFSGSVGSYSVTCKVTDSASTPVTSPASNAVSVTVNSTPTSTATPIPTAAPTPATTPTPKPTVTPTPSPTPSSTPTPSATTVPTTTDSGAIVDLALSGNITSSQISGSAISPNQSTAITTVSFIMTGSNGQVGFVNMTIPKSAVLYGVSPVVYINGQQAASQGYTQDANNFYVWYTAQFTTNLVNWGMLGSLPVTIQFAVPPTPLAASIGLSLALGIAVAVIISIFPVIAIKRLTRKLDNELPNPEN